MKTVIVFMVLLIALPVLEQGDCIGDIWVVAQDTGKYILPPIDWSEEYFVIALLELYEMYEKECGGDTLKAVWFEQAPKDEWHGSEFLIDRGSDQEMMSERQLNQKGYEFIYRWMKSNDPFVWEYIFVKRLTLPGFIKFLQKKINFKAKTQKDEQ